ncbi:hypothetical protein PInf_004864 [Phytophthora infestans]|nr:hypothetical protein PInf_004864 [Phytophthora infestans]
MLAQLSAITFEALRSTTAGANVCRCELDLDEKLIWNETNQDAMTRQLIAAIYVAYFEYDISKRDLSVAIAAVMAALKQMRQVEASSMDLQYIYAAKEFRTTYVGTADVDFRNYVAAYCSAYLAHTSEYTAPCITIKQSSGFGKSRILQRLAESTIPTPGGNGQFYLAARTVITQMMMLSLKS